MIINKHKRIGEIVIITEGSNPEYDIVTAVFHDIMGYEIISKKRGDYEFEELKGYDRFSRVILLNAPQSCIQSISDKDEFYDFLFKEIAQKYDVDLNNDATYIIFDRDNKCNRLGVVKSLLEALNQSQTDNEEQNGLLLLSYPSVEAFTVSNFEQNSFNLQFALGKDLKDYVKSKNYKAQPISEETLLNATDEFIAYLKTEDIISAEGELVDKTESLGLKILDRQTKCFQQKQVYQCVSQLVEILIDTGIITL